MKQANSSLKGSTTAQLMPWHKRAMYYCSIARVQELRRHWCRRRADIQPSNQHQIESASEELVDDIVTLAKVQRGHPGLTDNKKGAFVGLPSNYVPFRHFR
jgi:hypothetical protein